MRVGIYTLGCKVNTYESEFVTKLLTDDGYEISNFDDICDIYIINTCTVTNTSDTKSKKIIRQAKRRNKNACIIAMGCFIEANKQIEMEDIDIMLGNKDKSKIIGLIEEFYNNKNKVKRVYEQLDSTFEDMYIDKFTSRTRAFVKVQDGCENYCSYCIIPYVRGKCRSKPLNIAIKEIEQLVNNGFKEIVLTGIHTGNYGVDINTNFAELLRNTVKIEGIKRLRISSIEITELTEEVLDIIKNSNIIVNHIHIPLQSGSDTILQIMNRKYNIEYFYNKIRMIKENKEDVSITTDVIVGHPFETEELFDETIDNIKKIGFSKLHVFPYSIRSNTKAAAMEQVSEKIRKERAKKLLSLSKKLELDYMKQFLNREIEVLIETIKDNSSIGHTTNYLNILVNKELIPGNFYNVKIIEIDYPFCKAIIVDEK